MEDYADEQLKIEVEELRHKVNQYKQQQVDYVSLFQKSETLTKTNESLAVQVSQLNEQLLNLQSQQNVDLQNKNIQKDELISQLQQQLTEYEQKQQVTTNQLNHFKEETTRTKEKNERLEQTLQITNKRLQQQEVDIEQYKVQISNPQLKDERGELFNVIEKLNTLEFENKTLKQNIVQLELQQTHNQQELQKYIELNVNLNKQLRYFTQYEQDCLQENDKEEDQLARIIQIVNGTLQLNNDQDLELNLTKLNKQQIRCIIQKLNQTNEKNIKSQELIENLQKQLDRNQNKQIEDQAELLISSIKASTQQLTQDQSCILDDFLSVSVVFDNSQIPQQTLQDIQNAEQYLNKLLKMVKNNQIGSPKISMATNDAKILLETLQLQRQQLNQFQKQNNQSNQDYVQQIQQSNIQLKNQNSLLLQQITTQEIINEKLAKQVIQFEQEIAEEKQRKRREFELKQQLKEKENDLSLSQSFNYGTNSINKSQNNFLDPILNLGDMQNMTIQDLITLNSKLLIIVKSSKESLFPKMQSEIKTLKQQLDKLRYTEVESNVIKEEYKLIKEKYEKLLKFHCTMKQ